VPAFKVGEVAALLRWRANMRLMVFVQLRRFLCLPQSEDAPVSLPKCHSLRIYYRESKLGGIISVGKTVRYETPIPAVVGWLSGERCQTPAWIAALGGTTGCA